MRDKKCNTEILRRKSSKAVSAARELRNI